MLDTSAASLPPPILNSFHHIHNDFYNVCKFLKPVTYRFILYKPLFIASDSLQLPSSLITLTHPLFPSVSMPARRSQYSSAHKHRDRKRGKEAAREWEKGSCDSNKNERGARERWRLGWTSGRREGGRRGHTHVEQLVYVCVCVCQIERLIKQSTENAMSKIV